MIKLVKYSIVVISCVMNCLCITACASPDEKAEKLENSKYEEQVLETYQQANKMAGWFRIGTLDSVAGEHIDKGETT